MSILDEIKGGLIVSCQALENEPLHSSFIMTRMAEAAILGGAAGIRANSIQDICEIKKSVKHPVIGIIKVEYPDSHVYITPSMTEVDALVKCGCEIIAMDATDRKRPSGEILAEFFPRVREKYPDKLFMGDCSTIQEGLNAAEMGFDLIATTLCGYNDGRISPDFEMMSVLARNCGKPVVAEGNIWTPEQLRQAMDCGIHAAVVGSAITRPMLITRRFVSAIKGE